MLTVLQLKALKPGAKPYKAHDSLDAEKDHESHSLILDVYYFAKNAIVGTDQIYLIID